MSLICNICGYPAKITYKEQDETGKTRYVTETVACMEHPGVHPALWNRHPQHNKYRKFYNELKTKLRQPLTTED